MTDRPDDQPAHDQELVEGESMLAARRAHAAAWCNHLRDILYGRTPPDPDPTRKDTR